MLPNCMRRVWSRVAVVLLVGVLIPQAAPGQRNPIIRRPGDPAVVNFAPDDSAMNGAMAMARRSVNAFVQRVEHPPATQSYAGVKVRVAEGDVVEHIWASELSFDGTRLRGTLGNTHVNLRRVKMGDTVVVRPDSVSDWMIVDRDTVFGAFTVYVVRDRIPSADRAAFDRDMRIYFGSRPRLLSPPRP